MMLFLLMVGSMYVLVLEPHDPELCLMKKTLIHVCVWVLVCVCACVQVS